MGIWFIFDAPNIGGMKKIGLFFFLSIFFVNSKAQVTFQKIYSRSDTFLLTSAKLVVNETDTDFVFSCITYDKASAHQVACLEKANKQGNIIWSKYYMLASEDISQANSFIGGIDGGYILPVKAEMVTHTC